MQKAQTSINLTTSRLKSLGIIKNHVKQKMSLWLGEDIYKVWNFCVFKEIYRVFIALLFVTAKNWEGRQMSINRFDKQTLFS